MNCALQEPQVHTSVDIPTTNDDRIMHALTSQKHFLSLRLPLYLQNISTLKKVVLKVFVIIRSGTLEVNMGTTWRWNGSVCDEQVCFHTFLRE